MSGSFNPLDDPLFKAAVVRAKAVAVVTGASEISLQLLLKGFQILLENPNENQIGLLDNKSRVIASAVEGLVVSTPLDFEAARLVKMPVSDSLRKVLADSYSSLDPLIDALLNALVPEDLSEKLLFERVLSRASSACRVRGEQFVGPEAFSLAAFHAYLSGEFADRPALCAHIATNKESFETLLATNQWIEGSFAHSDSVSLPLSEVLVRQLAESPSPRLLTAINLGAEIGMSLRQLRITAIHEAGHAVVWFVLRPQVPITQISIVPSGDSEGRMGYDATSPYLRMPSTRRYFIEDTCVCLAGGLAQQLEFGPDSMDEGAMSDFSRATLNAWHWVARLGLDDEFGPVCLPAIAEATGSANGWLHDQAQQRVQQLLKDCMARTRAVLQENWHHVKAIADALVKRRTLGTEEFLELVVDYGLADWPGVRHVRSRPIRREVTFASTAGICETRERPVHFVAGDALVTGSAGEQWPVARVKFETAYESALPTMMGEKGWYLKRSREGLALQLGDARNIVLSKNRGVLSGIAGDWIVDHGDGDLAIVSGDLFPEYYEVLL